jgi:hypothetical protein
MGIFIAIFINKGEIMANFLITLPKMDRNQVKSA